MAGAIDLYDLRANGAAVTPTNPLPVSTGAPGTATATIANGASLSGAVDLADTRLHRIAMPATWTSAGLSFQVSADNSNWFDLYTDLGEYTISSSVAGVSRSIVVDQSLFYGVRYVKVRSGTSGSPVAQGGSRDLTLVTATR